MKNQVESSTKAISLENGSELSFQQYQDVYNRLTGRAEKVRKIFFDKHLVTLEHLVNLNDIIEQGVEQYTCHSASVTISVFYVDGTSERWSSFEKLKLQAPNKSVCAESVEIEYDLLLTLPKLTDPRPYKVIFGCRSELGFQKKLDLESASSLERRMARSMRMGTARLSISYVDLVVARSFEAFITNWFSALPKVDETFVKKVIRVLTPASNIFTRVLIILTASFLCYLMFSHQISDNFSLFRFGLLSFAIVMLANIMSFKVAEIISGLFSSFATFSHIRLSSSDDSAKIEQTNKASKLVAVAILSWLGIVVTGVAINYLTKFLLQ